MRIAAILFDLDQTLLYDHQLEIDILRQLAKELCPHPPDDPFLLEMLTAFRKGRLALEKAIAQCGCDYDEFCRRVLQEAPHRVTAVPGLPLLYAGLQDKQIPFGALSNGWTELQQCKASIIHFPGPVLVSEALGHWKPNPLAFTTACDILSFPKAETLYVGDSPEVDIVGAKEAGLLAAWVNGRNHLYPPGLPKEPDAILTAIEQVLGLVS